MSAAQAVFDTILGLARGIGRRSCECASPSTCSACGGTGLVQEQEYSAWMVAFVSAATVENAGMILDAGDVATAAELVLMARDYVAKARELEMQKHSDDEFSAVLQHTLDALGAGTQVSDVRRGQLTPQEIADLLGSPPAGAVRCVGCGNYTYGMPLDPHLPRATNWVVDGKFACCHRDACIAAWDDALDTAIGATS